MFSFNSILLFSEKPEDLASFYKKVFNKDPDWVENGYSGFKLGQGLFVIGPHDHVHGKNQQPERIVINFETEDVEKEFQRIKSLGTDVIKEPYHPGEDNKMTIATLVDPDGNYFQLGTPMSA